MSSGGAIAAAGASLTGIGGIVAAAVGISPWPLLAALAVIGAAVVVLGVVVLTAARTDNEIRHHHAHEVLRTLVFAARGEHARPLLERSHAAQDLAVPADSASVADSSHTRGAAISDSD